MLLKRIVRFIPFRPSELFRIMMPPALLLSVCSRGLEAAEKTYQPTQAQRRLAEQQRLQNQRIAEIRRRNAERNAAKTAAAQAAEKRAKAAAAAAPSPDPRYRQVLQIVHDPDKSRNRPAGSRKD